ncbi:DcrB-related protein [Erwinia oleae]|uniref:DcrB-related protein n=1 Tax=Erwinia oleae TaxID=796334 RepID=UPI000907C6EF|nr:DcrB-related protein [Erwinia oleae]
MSSLDLHTVICPEGLIAVPSGAAVHTMNIIVFPDGSSITVTRDTIPHGSTFSDYLAVQKQKLQSGLQHFTELKTENPVENPVFSEGIALAFTHAGNGTKTWQYTFLATPANNNGHVMLFGSVCQTEIHHNIMREKIIESATRFSLHQA